jgi:hypothetical protein
MVEFLSIKEGPLSRSGFGREGIFGGYGFYLNLITARFAASKNLLLVW